MALIHVEFVGGPLDGSRRECDDLNMLLTDTLMTQISDQWFREARYELQCIAQQNGHMEMRYVRVASRDTANTWVRREKE